MKKLSPTQIKVLQALAEPEVVAHYMPYMGWFRPKDYWFVSNGSNIRKGVTEKLINLGLLQRIQEGFKDAYATITPAGRAYLEKLDKEGE